MFCLSWREEMSKDDTKVHQRTGTVFPEGLGLPPHLPALTFSLCHKKEATLKGKWSERTK